MADDRKTVELHITGKDDSGAAAKSAAAGVRDITKAVDQQAAAYLAAAEAAAELYQKTSRDLTTAQQKALDARKAYDAFAVSVAGVAEPTRKQVREFENLGKAADKADAEVAKLQTSLSSAESKFNDNLGKAGTAQADSANRDVLTKQSLQYASAIEEAEAAQQRLAKLSAFRDIGAQAQQGAAGLGQFNAATLQMAAGADRLQADLIGIIDPAKLARTTLDGLAGEAARVAAVVGGADKPIRNYQDAINDLGRIQASVLSQGGAVSAYREQAVAVGQAEAAFKAAKADVLSYAEAIRTAETPNEALVSSLRQAEAVMAAADAQLQNQTTKLQRLKAPLDAAGISVNKLSAAETKLRSVAETTAAAVTKLDKAMAGQNSKTGTFLGLRPYELQNLGFQLNDVFTQIASGTSITQTFAQQGGQILQLFPGIFSKILSFAGPLTLIIGTATLALGAIKAFLNQEETLRSFTGQLTANADGARFSAAAMTENIETLQGYGLALKDARAAGSSFLKTALDPKQFVDFGKAAKDTADVIGGEVPAAAEKLADGFSKGYEGVKALDDAMNFLTSTQREQIKAMFESGDAQGALTLAFGLYTDKMEKAAADSRGPWAQASREFNKAFGELMDTLGNSAPIKNTINDINELIRAATAGIKALDALNKPGSITHQSPLLNRFGMNPFTAGQSFVNSFNTPAGGAAGAAPPVDPSVLSATQKETKAYQEQKDALRDIRTEKEKTNAIERIALAGQKALRAAESKGITSQKLLADLYTDAANIEKTAIEKEIKQEAEREKHKADADARSAAAAARRDASAKETAERRRAATEQAVVQAQLSQDAKLTKATKDGLADRQELIDRQTAETLKKVKAAEAAGNKTIGGQPVADVRAQITATGELLKQQDTMVFYADQLKTLESTRKDKLKEIDDQQQAGLISGQQALDAVAKANADITPKIQANAQAAITFAQSIAGATPPPALEAFIARMQAALAGETSGSKGGNGDLAAANTRIRQTEETKLNEIISARNDLEQVNNELAATGAITQAAADERNKKLFADSALAINTQIANYTALLQQQLAAGDLTQQQFDAIIAKLGLVGQQSQFVSASFQQVKTTLMEGLANGGAELFGTLGDALGGLIDGTMSLKDGIGSLWAAFRNFAADFLRQIAMMIAKQLLLNLLQKSLGASGGGGFLGFLSSAISGGVAHQGRVIDGGGPQRQISALAYLNAPRYHDGTVGVGLKANETTAILKRGEEVLSDSNPRNMKNWRAGAPAAEPSGGTKIVNVFNPADVLEASLADTRGQNVLLNHVQKNPSAFRRALGV